MIEILCDTSLVLPLKYGSEDVVIFSEEMCYSIFFSKHREKTEYLQTIVVSNFYVVVL